MKKLLISLLAITCLSFVEAQTAFHQGVSKPTGAYSNAQIDTMSYTLANSYTVVGIQPVVTKLTGTMAGNAILYNSINGTNWVATGDTLTFTNVATNTTVWSRTSTARYWKIVVAGGTTLTGTAAAKISVK